MSIATFIKHDLAARLKSGRALPAQLTLDSLAEHYKVSFSPVRTAVAELIDEGLLEKGSNRRLVVSTCPETEMGSPPPASLPEQPFDSFEVIANDLVQMSLRGEPVHLREEATAEKYGISRSAIRNILHRLAGEGVLDHIPRRGWRLRPFREDDLKAFVEVREVLELKAMSLAWPKLDDAALERMLGLNRPPDSAEDGPHIDESLHHYLIHTAGNAYIQDFFARQGRYYRLFFKWEDRDLPTALETIRQHREILKALIHRDRPAAQAALSHHILNHHPMLIPEMRDLQRGGSRS